MSGAETVEFKITLSSEWYRLPVHVQVYLNDDLIEDTEITERESEGESREIKFTSQLEDGPNRLRIRYLDKETPDTTIDEGGNIVKDHLLNIKEIEIDEIELGYLCFSKGKFFPDRDIRPDLPEEMCDITCFGYNGTYVLEFQVPTYIWFLENL